MRKLLLFLLVSAGGLSGQTWKRIVADNFDEPMWEVSNIRAVETMDEPTTVIVTARNISGQPMDRPSFIIRANLKDAAPTIAHVQCVGSRDVMAAGESVDCRGPLLPATAEQLGNAHESVEVDRDGTWMSSKERASYKKYIYDVARTVAEHKKQCDTLRRKPADDLTVREIREIAVCTEKGYYNWELAPGKY